MGENVARKGWICNTSVRERPGVERTRAELFDRLMAESLERAEADKRRMIADAARELRTYLTKVIGLLDAMRDGLRPPDAETLDAARYEAGLLHALVGELQELSLLESGKAAVELEDIDLVLEARRAGRWGAPGQMRLPARAGVV